MLIALAIAKQALDWEIDGAIKTAAVAFMAAWFVALFGFYISDYWDKHKAKGSVLLVVGGAAICLVWWAYLPIGREAARALDQLEMIKRLVSELERETFLRRYPLGYAIFYADHENKVIPYDAKFYTAYELDWSAIKLTQHPEFGTVTLALPTLREKGSGDTGLAFSPQLYGPKRVGLINCSTAMPSSDKPEQALTVCGEIIAIRGTTVVYLIGVRDLRVPVMR